MFFVQTQTVTKTEHHSYTTRAQTRSGKQQLELPVKMKAGKVAKTTHFEFGGPIGKLFVLKYVWKMYALSFI